jgi:Tol biopolymer transport system component
MHKFFQTAIPVAAVAMCTALVLAQSAPTDDEKAKAKAKADRKAQDIARVFEQNARTLTLFDRQGKSLGTIGKRGMYGGPSLSPDGKRVAYSKADLDKETQDLWVMDLATGNEVQLTAGKAREGNSPPVWSPDGSQVAYTGLREGNFSIYRKAANGQGAEEFLYKLAGVGAPTDWSADGRYLTLSASDLGGGVLSALPLNASGERKPVEILHIAKQVQGGRLSPDGHLIAYLSNETGKNEVYIRAFDPEGKAAAAPGGPWQISDQGALGMTSWRKDGKEFYFMAADRSIMSVAVNASPVGFEKPKKLFQPAPEIAAMPGMTAISRDGDRVLIGVPPPQLRQLTIFDRQGKPVRTAADPSQFIVQPHFSADGRKITYMKQDPKTSDVDIWTYDLENGKEYAVTRDNWPENAPIWAPDGKRVIYVSTRDNYSGIYRKNWDGTGDEELLFRYTPGAGMVLTDSTPDGKYLVFYTGVLVLAPLTGTDPLARKPIDWLRDEYDNVGGKFSPDGRFIAYAANPEDPMALDIFVRPFDSGKADSPPAGAPVRISKNGVAVGMISWREDGKELYFMTRDWEVMAVDITTAPTFTAGTPKMLFKLPVQPVGNPFQWDNVSRDGQRFVFSMPAPR